LRAPRQQYDISGAHDASNIEYRRDPAGPDGHACSAAAIGLLDSAGFDIMAVHGDLLAVYRGVRQFAIPTGTHTTPPHYEVCRIGADHQITTVWNYEDRVKSLRQPKRRSRHTGRTSILRTDGFPQIAMTCRDIQLINHGLEVADGTHVEKAF
jgi:hypothetical protein